VPPRSRSRNHLDSIHRQPEYEARPARIASSSHAPRQDNDGRVWSSHSIWTTQACLRVIGIQSAAVTNKYLRAKGWGTVLETMTMMDDELDAEAKKFVWAFMERTGYRPNGER
jgi:hypothetical protein